MRIVRFEIEGRKRYGLLEGDSVVELGASPFRYAGWAAARGEAAYPLRSVRLLAPCRPSKIVGLGLNYRTHAAEIDLKLPAEPLIFLKPPTAVAGPGEAIVLPSSYRRVDYEGELAVVIGRRARNVPESLVRRYVLGYTCFNDVTEREIQRSDGQWTRAKGFDTFAPLGPCIRTDLDPGDLEVETRVNSELKQSGRTSALVFPVDTLVSFISRVMTLLPGDVIATGTPAGIGPLAPGDTVEVRIEGIGSLCNPVISNPASA